MLLVITLMMFAELRTEKPHENTCYADPEGSDKLLLLQRDQKWTEILRKALVTHVFMFLSLL